MGLIDVIRQATRLPGDVTTGLPAPVLASPMSPRPNHLEAIVWADLIDRDYKPISRADAMRVPALARARQLIVTTVARLPLRAMRGGEPLETQPSWLDRTDGPVSPYHRMLMTADDLLFYGWSLWAVRRGADGYVIAADRVPIENWELREGLVIVNDRPARNDEVVLIPGIHEGILAFGDETIKQARGLLHSAAKAATTPNAMVNLAQKSGAPMSDEDIDKLISRWAAARRGENGGVSFTNNAIEVEELGSAKEHLLIEGRNASAVDVARLCGIPAAMIDATLNGTSLSYTNTQSRLAELINFGVAPMLGAIAARLGLDDVVPRGVALEFDITESIAPVDAIAPPDDRNTREATTPEALVKRDGNEVKNNEQSI